MDNGVHDNHDDEDDDVHDHDDLHGHDVENGVYYGDDQDYDHCRDGVQNHLHNGICDVFHVFHE